MARTDILYDVPGGDIIVNADKVQSPIGTASWSSQAELKLPAIADGEGAYVTIPWSNNSWKYATVNSKKAYAMISGELRNFYPFELVGISPNKLYYVRNESGIYYIYSGECSDFQIDVAKPQNTSLLLLCKPGNSRRFPTVGVHVRRYINSHLEKQDLAKRILAEFSNDNVSVISTNYNEETGNIDIVTTENEK